MLGQAENTEVLGEGAEFVGEGAEFEGAWDGTVSGRKGGRLDAPMCAYWIPSFVVLRNLYGAIGLVWFGLGCCHHPGISLGPS